MESTLLIEAAAALTLIAASVYAAARGIRVRQLGAHFYYRPKRAPVALSTTLKEVFPDVHLPAKEREQIRRYGIDGGGPPWTEWIHRHNLADLSIISKSGESGWSGALTLHRLQETDGHLTEALSHLMHRRIEAFSDLRKPPYRKGEVNGGADDSDVYDTQYAEHVVADSLKGRAHHVTFTGGPDDAVHRTVVDGRAFDLGSPLRFDFQNHFGEYPGTSVLTPEDFFRPEEGIFTIDHSRGSYKLSILGGAGFDAVFGTDRALASPHVPIPAGGGDVDFQNPFLTLGLSTLREIRLLKKKHTNLLTSVKNIGLDAAGTGIGSFAGAKAGATIGTAVAPGMGSVVGAIIGGISGAFAGRSISNRIKFSQAEAARTHYEEKMVEFQRRVQEVTRGALNTLETMVAREQSTLGAAGLKRIRELESLTQRLESRRRSSYLLSDESMREFFARCEADIRAEAGEINKALHAFPFTERVLWPEEGAVRLRLERKHVTGHMSELVRARSALLDPACSLGDAERTEVCLELIAAFGGHEEAIRKHLARYRSVVIENLNTLVEWPAASLRELGRIRASALRRIGSKADQLRQKTGEELKRDVTRAKRAQTGFAKELRKLGLLR